MTDLKQERRKEFKQRLQRVHVVVGILFSILMYLCVFFGIFAIFLTYIDDWEKPSKHYERLTYDNINLEKAINPILKDENYPKAHPIDVYLPDDWDVHLYITTKFTKEKLINAKTYEEMKDEGDSSNLARFLNQMHYGRPLSDIFMHYIFGAMAVAAVFLTIGGILQVILIKYQKNGKSIQSKFSKWHRQIFTWLFVPFFFIALTGAILNFGIVSNPITYLVTKGEATNPSKILNTLQEKEIKIKKNNEIVPMLEFRTLLDKAQGLNPNFRIQGFTLYNWFDSSAQIKIKVYDTSKPFLNGSKNSIYIMLNASDGSIIKETKVFDAPWIKIFEEAIYAVHFLFNMDILIRILIAIFMLFCGAGVGFATLYG